MKTRAEYKKENKKKKKISLKKSIKTKIKRKRNILSLLAVVATLVLIFAYSFLDILPLKYNLLLSFILVVIDILGIYFINIKKKVGLKILGILILILTIVGGSFGSYYLVTTNNFMNKSFGNGYVISKHTYYVLAKKEFNLTKDDITGDVAASKEMANFDKASKKIESKYDAYVKEYEDLGEVFDGINRGIDKFMLIDQSSYEIVFSIDTKLKKENYEILYQYDIYTREKAGSGNTDKFNIYIAGADFTGLADLNMIATVNTKTHKVVLTSIPRDYYIQVAGKNGQYDKLSFMSAYGANVSKESLENLFGINIDYTILINTDSLVTIVDYIGGIDFCSEYAYTTTHAMVTDTYDDTKGQKLVVRKGCQHLNGVQTLTVARERNAFPGRDRVRQQNCQKIMIAIFKKLVGTDTIIHYNETLNTVGTAYQTDMPKKVVTNIAKDILNNGNHWKIKTQSVDGTDGKNKVHLSNMTDWVMYPDQKTVKKASKTIKNTLK